MAMIILGFIVITLLGACSKPIVGCVSEEQIDSMETTTTALVMTTISETAVSATDTTLMAATTSKVKPAASTESTETTMANPTTAMTNLPLTEAAANPPTTAAVTTSTKSGSLFDSRALFDELLPYALSVGYTHGEYTTGMNNDNGVAVHTCDFFMPGGRCLRLMYSSQTDGSLSLLYIARNADGSGLDFGALDSFESCKTCIANMI